MVVDADVSTSREVVLLSGRKAGLLLFALIMCVLSFQLNASMVTPALPEMARELGVSTQSISLVTSLFFLMNAVGGLVIGRWSDFIGRRTALILVLVVLAVGNLVCVFAPSLPILLLGRVLQGASGAAFTLCYITLGEYVRPARFAAMMGVITAVNGGVGGLDGFVGGLLSDRFGFRSIFVVILVFGLIALLTMLPVVPRHRNSTPVGTMDWTGAAAFSLFLVFLTYFVSQGSSAGWLAGSTLLLLAAAVASFAAFVGLSRRKAHPLIAVTHLASRRVWPVVITTLLCLSSVFAVINFTVVLLSQDDVVGFGMNASLSSLLFLTPPALIGLAAAPLSGRLAGRFGWTRILHVGLVLAILALAVVAVLPTHQWVVFAAICSLGISYNGLILTATNGLGVVQSPSEAPGALPGINGAAFGVGASLGIGIVAPLVSSGGLGGFAAALWVSIGISVLALVCSFLIRPVTPTIAPAL